MKKWVLTCLLLAPALAFSGGEGDASRRAERKVARAAKRAEKKRERQEKREALKVRSPVFDPMVSVSGAGTIGYEQLTDSILSEDLAGTFGEDIEGDYTDDGVGIPPSFTDAEGLRGAVAVRADLTVPVRKEPGPHRATVSVGASGRIGYADSVRRYVGPGETLEFEDDGSVDWSNAVTVDFYDVAEISGAGELHAGIMTGKNLAQACFFTQAGFAHSATGERLQGTDENGEEYSESRSSSTEWTLGVQPGVCRYASTGERARLWAGPTVALDGETDRNGWELGLQRIGDESEILVAASLSSDYLNPERFRTRADAALRIVGPLWMGMEFDLQGNLKGDPEIGGFQGHVPVVKGAASAELRL